MTVPAWKGVLCYLNKYPAKVLVCSLSTCCVLRQPIEQTAIILDIQLFLNCLRQRKISIKLLFVRLYHMLFGACNGNISEVDCA